jgi:hypothetical protein
LFFTPGTHTIQRNRTHIYNTFIPNSLNARILIKSDEELTMLLSKAHRFLGVLEGTARWIKNIDAIETAFMAKEAFLSCKIEDSKATLEEMLYSTKKKNKHLQETQCYLETINKTMKIKDEAYSNLSLCSKNIIICEKLTYWFIKPSINDIIILDYTGDTLVKRVEAVEGDSIKMENHILYCA